MQHFWCYSQGFCWDLISHVDGLNGPCAMLFAQGGKLCVSRVRVKALLPFWRVLAISRPLTQPTLGIMGINEWYFVTLASCSHFGISTLQQSGVVFFCFVCCFCVLWLSRECVFVCNESECVFPDLWGKKKKKFTHKHFPQGQPWQCRPPIFWDPCAPFGNKSNKRTSAIWKAVESSPQCTLRQ